MKMTPQERFKETIAKKHGIIFCYGPDGEYYEARTIREASSLTGLHRNTIDYAMKHKGRTRSGWRVERGWK